jgi:hypothetical protein
MRIKWTIAFLAICALNILVWRGALHSINRSRTLKSQSHVRDVLLTLHQYAYNGLKSWRSVIGDEFEGKLLVEQLEKHPYYCFGTDLSTNILAVDFPGSPWQTNTLPQTDIPVLIEVKKSELNWSEPGDLVVGFQKVCDGDLTIDDLKRLGNNKVTVIFGNFQVKEMMLDDLKAYCVKNPNVPGSD